MTSGRRIKVVVLNDRPHRLYGTQRTSIEVAEILLESGLDVTLLTTGDGPLVDECLRRGLDTRILQAPPSMMTFDKAEMFGSVVSTARSSVEILRFGSGLVKVVRELKADVALAMTNRMGMLLPALRFAGVRTFVYGQNTIPLGWRAVPVVIGANRLPQMSPRSFEAYPGILRRAFRSKFELLPLGIDTAPFAMERSVGLGTEPLEVLAIAKIGERKGTREMVEAVADVRRSGIDIRLTIVGDATSVSDEQLLTGLRAQHRDVVTFAGFVADVTSYLRKADIGLIGSKEEGGPRVLFEMMAAGLPVVTTDVGYCREVVEGGACGLVVDRGDAASLAEALSTLAADATLRRRLGDAGRCCANERYTVSVFAERLTALMSGDRSVAAG